MSIFFNDIDSITVKETQTIEDLAEKYHQRGCGDPKLGLPNNPSAHEGQFAYVFEGTSKATEFSNEVLELEYVLEVRIGEVKDS